MLLMVSFLKKTEVADIYSNANWFSLHLDEQFILSKQVFKYLKAVLSDWIL